MASNPNVNATLVGFPLPEYPRESYFTGFIERSPFAGFKMELDETFNIAIIGAILGGLAVAFVNKYTDHPCLYLFIGGFLLAMYYHNAIAYGIALVMIADAVYQFITKKGYFGTSSS